MGENFQAGVCGSTWWSSPRGSIGFSSPCLMSVNDNGNFGWPIHDLVEIKARPSTTRGVSNVTFNQGSICCDHFMQKPSECTFVDSTLQMMDISGSSKSTTTTDWNHNLISGRESNEINYRSPMVEENMSSSQLNFRKESDIFNPTNNQIQNEWSLKNFSQDSTINELEQASTTQGSPIHPSLPSSSFNYPSTLIENLFGNDQLPLENQTIDFPPTSTYQTNLNEFSPSLTKFPSSIRPSLRQRHEIDPLHLTNNIPFWNGSSAAPNHISASIFHSAQLVEKTNFRNLKPKSNNGVVHESKRSSTEAAPKKPRIETPSPLPTFKVRKEKLGDRITALQQLVSPFGKTDTASVLQEAIEYIKFLHDQVNVLSTPYIKNGAPIQHQQKFDTLKDPEGPKQDLRGRGLCLVPISSTFPVATETTVDFWTPTFGGTFG